MILTSTDGHFEMLALRTIAGDELKDGAIMQRLFKRSSITFCMCVGLYDQNQDCLEHKACINCN